MPDYFQQEFAFEGAVVASLAAPKEFKLAKPTAKDVAEKLHTCLRLTFLMNHEFLAIIAPFFFLASRSFVLLWRNKR